MSAHPGSVGGRGRHEYGPGDLLPGIQRRIEWTFYLLLLPLFFLAARLVELQALPLDQRATATLPAAIFTRHEVLPSQRGQLLATDGTALAVTLNEYSVCANPRAVKDKEKVASLIASAIGGDASDYVSRLNQTEGADGKPNYYVRLARHVDEERADHLRTVMGPAGKDEKRQDRAARRKLWEPITLEPTPRRQYPLGDFASQLIGFSTPSGHGADGLEKAWDRYLAGTPGEMVSQVDARGRPVPGLVREWRPPVPGQTVVTTIDPQIQADSDAVMRHLVQQYKPNFAVSIVMRPRTGEIVAMSTAPSYDLNNHPQNIVDLATNRCVNFAYEPGSTFKIITASAAVETVPEWRSHSFYCNGAQMVGKHMLHCWISHFPQQRHGQETLSDSIRDSCNFGVYGFARLAGARTMMEYARRFGVGQAVNLAGLAEQPGLLPRNDPDGWSQEQLANFAFGQGMLLTPLQLVRVAATIANDGVMMKPLLVKEIRNDQGKVVQVLHPEVDHKVIEPATAHIVTGMMERVTREGTARKYVFVPGYVTAGKTGSAQKAVGRHGYAAGRFISSFIGFLPSRNPEFVILVMADEPHGSHWGSEVCGPAFAAIANQAMLRLRLREGTAAPAPVAALMTRPKAVEKKAHAAH